MAVIISYGRGGYAKEMFNRCEPNALTSAKGGNTPLHCAAAYGRTEGVRALIQAGADVNARTEKFNGSRTPLEIMLYQNRRSFSVYLEIADLLLDAGTELSEDAARSARDVAESYQLSKRGNSRIDPEYRSQQDEALPKFCALFGIPVPNEIPFHDGLSPIVIEETEFDLQFQKLWDYLIPASGHAATAQREALRIAGRLMDNGEQSELLCRLAVKWIMQNSEVILPLDIDYKR